MFLSIKLGDTFFFQWKKTIAPILKVKWSFPKWFETRTKSKGTGTVPLTYTQYTHIAASMKAYQILMCYMASILWELWSDWTIYVIVLNMIGRSKTNEKLPDMIPNKIKILKNNNINKKWAYSESLLSDWTIHLIVLNMIGRSKANKKLPDMIPYGMLLDATHVLYIKQTKI
jgi:hypothetical protein